MTRVVEHNATNNNTRGLTSYPYWEMRDFKTTKIQKIIQEKLLRTKFYIKKRSVSLF